jgi:hypothetical protein
MSKRRGQHLVFKTELAMELSSGHKMFQQIAVDDARQSVRISTFVCCDQSR